MKEGEIGRLKGKECRMGEEKTEKKLHDGREVGGRQRETRWRKIK